MEGFLTCGRYFSTLGATFLWLAFGFSDVKDRKDFYETSEGFSVYRVIVKVVGLERNLSCHK